MATSTFDFIVRDAASTAAGGGGDGSVPKDDTSAVMKENNALTRKVLQQNLGIQPFSYTHLTLPTTPYV